MVNEKLLEALIKLIDSLDFVFVILLIVFLEKLQDLLLIYLVDLYLNQALIMV